jgi:hypothetical protein
VLPAPALVIRAVREANITAVKFALEATLNTDKSPILCGKTQTT